jgi:hypothetical protein
MKTLSLKQIRTAALCLAAASFLVGGAHSVRTVAPPAPHAITTHTLLADGGQETHGGKGHRTTLMRLA